MAIDNEPSPRLLETLRIDLEHDGLGSSGSLPESIADRVDRFIERESLRAGALLGTKSELASIFGVAPSTLSEATKILVSRGSVRLRQGPKGGVLVADQRPVLRLARSMVRLTDGDNAISDVVDVRDALEATVAHDALRHRTSADLVKLRDNLREIELANDSTTTFRAVLSLHAAIAEAGANGFLKIVYLTAVRTLLSRTQHVTPPGSQADADELRRERVAVHRALVDAIEAQDPTMLAQAIKRHGSYRP